MNLATFLTADHVFTNQRFSSKTLMIRDLAKKASGALEILANPIEAALINRENLGSTGMGAGIALPHAHLAEVEKPFGMTLKLRPPLKFDAIDELPVDIVFLLLLPASQNNVSMDALASVARKLREPATLKHVRRAEDPQEIFAALTG